MNEATLALWRWGGRSEGGDGSAGKGTVCTGRKARGTAGWYTYKTDD